MVARSDQGVPADSVQSALDEQTRVQNPRFEHALPSQAWLSQAELSQEGFDLVLTLHGETHRVPDYFSFQTPPSLTLETGPSLTPTMVKSLLPRSFSQEYFYAGPAVDAGLGEAIGRVSLLAGTATVRRADGSTSALSKGDPVYKGDVLVTGEGSFVKIRFIDGTTFQLGKNGEAALDDFDFNESANIGNFEASVRVGGFYYKSGKIGEVTKASGEAHTKLSTPSSIIAVRGSELEGAVSPDGQTSVIHRSGILVVTDQNGENGVELSTPGATAVVARGGGAIQTFDSPPASVLNEIASSVTPQTGDDSGDDEAVEEEVAEEESAEEEETAEESEEESEEDAEEESEEDAEEESEEESEEEAEEEAAEEEAEEEAAEEESAEEEAVEEESTEEEAAEEESAEEEAAEEESAEEEAAEEESAEEEAAEEESAEEEAAEEESAEEEAAEEATEESAEEAAEESAEESAEEAAEESAEEATEESAEEAAEESAEEATEESVEEAAEESVEESAEESVEEAAEESTEEAAEGSASEEGAGEEAEAEGSASEESAGEEAEAEGSASEEGEEVEAEGSASEDGAGEEAGAGESASEEGASEDAGAEESALEEGAVAEEAGGEESATEDSSGEDAGASEESAPDDGGGDSASAEESPTEDASAESVVSEESGAEGEASSDAGEDQAPVEEAATEEAASDDSAASVAGGDDASSVDSAAGDDGSNASQEAGSDEPASSAEAGTESSETSTATEGSDAVSESAEETGSTDNIEANSAGESTTSETATETSAGESSAETGSASEATGSDSSSTDSAGGESESTPADSSAGDASQSGADSGASADAGSASTDSSTTGESATTDSGSATTQSPTDSAPSESESTQATGDSGSDSGSNTASASATDSGVASTTSESSSATSEASSSQSITQNNTAAVDNSSSSDSTSTSQTQTQTNTSTATSEETTISDPVQPVQQEQVSDAVPDNPPNANPDSLQIVDATAINLSEVLVINDSDPDEGQSPVLDSVDLGTASGSLETSSGQTFFTPDAQLLAGLDEGETVAETFSYTVLSGELGAASEVTVTYVGSNDAPSPQNDDFVFEEANSLTLNVLANDTDIDNESITISEVRLLSGEGELTISEDGLNLVYASNTDLSEGTDSVTAEYTVSDGDASATAIVTLTLVSQNDEPVAVQDEFTVLESVATILDVLQNDVDVDADDVLQIVSVDDANLVGSVSISEDGQNLLYTSAEVIGAAEITEILTYTVSDGETTSTTTVTLVVLNQNDAPVAQPDNFTVQEGVTTPLDVLLNDTDQDAEDVLQIVSAGTNDVQGTVTISEDGKTLLYTSNPIVGGQDRSDTLNYSITDGEDTVTGTVTITVLNQNDAPAASPDQLAISEDQTAIVDVLANDTDADGDTLTIASIDTSTLRGSATISDDGLTINYQPPQDLSEGELQETLTYVATDGSLSSTSTLTVTVTGVNDPPVIVSNPAAFTLDLSAPQSDTSTVNEEGEVEYEIPLNAIFTDADEGAEFTVLELDSAGLLGSVRIGSVIYTPGDGLDPLAEGETITETFGITAEDQYGAVVSGSFSFTVVGVNDPPISTDDSAAVEASQSITLNAETGLLSNDSDVDGDSLVVEEVTAVTPGLLSAAGQSAGSSVVGLYGTLTVQSDGSYVYSADQAAARQLAPDAVATEEFSVLVSDNRLSAASTLTISVSGVDDPSVFFGDDSFTIDKQPQGQRYPIQGVLSSFDVDDHATIAPVDRAEGSAGFGYFGYSLVSELNVDNATVIGTVAPLPVDGLPTQIIDASMGVIESESGTHSLDLVYSTSDNNSSLSGLALRVHYNSSVIKNVQVDSSIAGFQGASDQADDADLDQDASTDRFVLIAWADPNSAWPGVLDEILATLIFDVDLSQGSLDWTTLRITGETAAGYALETQIIQVYGDQERPEQIEGTLAAGVWGYTPDSDKFAALSHNETVQDTFTFEASDGSLHPVTVTLIGENDAPVFAGSLDLPLDAAGQYLFDSTDFNSSDVDNSSDEVIYGVVSVEGGELLVNGTVANQFSQADVDSGNVVFISSTSVSVPGEASPSLVFTVDDGDEDQSEPEALVVQFFDGSQNLIFVEDQALKAMINTVTVIVLSSLLENDVSASGGAISIASIDSQSEFGGSVTSDGFELTYTPPVGFTGTDRIFYTITNESGDVASAYLDISVTADPTASTKSQPMFEADFAGVFDSGESGKDQGSPWLSGSVSSEDESLHLNSMGISRLSEVVSMPYDQFSVPVEPAQYQVATSDDATSAELAADSPNRSEGKYSVGLEADPAGELPRLTDTVMLSDSTEPLEHRSLAIADAFLSGKSIDFGSLDEFVKGQIQANEMARSGGPIDISGLDIGLADMFSSVDEDLVASDVPQSLQITMIGSDSPAHFKETISMITEENLLGAPELRLLENILTWDDQYTGLI